MFFQLTDDLIFPPTYLADEDGLLAMGGDLSSERLILAYKSGIFPWYNDDTPILWYAPHERFVLFPEKVKISKSMKRLMRSNRYSITYDNAFSDVIMACADIERKEQDGTWITNDMQEAYTRLHKLGISHSIEVWEKEQLVGGLYGVLINRVFCGESMFSKASNASKLALIWLSQNADVDLIDCQVYTEHLESMGAEMLEREKYMAFL